MTRNDLEHHINSNTAVTSSSAIAERPRCRVGQSSRFPITVDPSAATSSCRRRGKGKPPVTTNRNATTTRSATRRGPLKYWSLTRWLMNPWRQQVDATYNNIPAIPSFAVSVVNHVLMRIALIVTSAVTLFTMYWPLCRKLWSSYQLSMNVTGFVLIVGGMIATQLANWNLHFLEHTKNLLTCVHW